MQDSKCFGVASLAIGVVAEGETAIILLDLVEIYGVFTGCGSCCGWVGGGIFRSEQRWIRFGYAEISVVAVGTEEEFECFF